MSKLVIPGVIAQSGNGGGSGSITPISPLQYQTTSEVVTETVPYNIYYYETADDLLTNPELQSIPYTSDTVTMTEDDLQNGGLLFQFNKGYQPTLDKDFRITGKFFISVYPFMEIFLKDLIQELGPDYYTWNENNLIDIYRDNEGDPISVHFYPKNFTGSTTTVDEELNIPCSEITGDNLLYEIYYNHTEDKATFTFKQSDETLIGSASIENFSTKVEFGDKITVDFWTNQVDYPTPIDGIYKFETIEVKEVTTKNLELNYDDSTLTVTDGELTVIGGGGTVDQTYDPTSTNAQSGTAVAEAVQPALKNTATATGSLVILGTPTWGTNSIAIGNSATVYAHGAVAIGQSTSITNGQGVAIGSSAKADGSGVGIGVNAKAQGNGSIQLGSGTNSTANTFQVWTYPMLDGNTGKIFSERLPSGNSVEVTDTIPTPSSSNVGQVKLYSGTTTSDFTNGYLYQCKLESTTSETVTFDSDKVVATPEIFWLIVKLALPETYSNVTNGYITYNESASLVTFTFKDANGNTLGEFPADVGEISAIGITFNNLVDGDVINFTCSSSVVESYKWEPVIVQESSEIKVYNAASWSENTTLFPNRSLPLPNLDDLTDAGLYRVKFNCSMPNIEVNLDYLCQVSVVNASGTILGHFQTLQVFYPGLNEDKGISVTLYRSKQTGSTWSDWKSSLVTSVSNNSTDVEYVSAKLFYDTCGNIEALINAL